ncbi:MAG TPA: DNA cytosine methyltransferase [Thermoanaerobaculia bacterium]|nr:DNA cytosine methyltransferase [Thermoanaerobaculia bacterium]
MRTEPTLEEVLARSGDTPGLIIDLFAGGGGASTGLEAALGRPIDVAVNHDRVALDVHRANHPDTFHSEADIWEAQPQELVQGRRVHVLWASPDCTHFSVAKGGKPRKQSIRSLAWAVTKWLKATRADICMLENVGEFKGWGPLGPDNKPDKKRMGETFRMWVKSLEKLGYRVEHRVLDASRYGAPTRRKRLFLIARRDGLPIVWPEPTHGPGLLPFRTAAECIDWTIPCPSIFERAKPLADKTLWRIAQGIRRFVLESPRPFIVEMNHSNAPREVNEPLGVVTTQHNRFNLVVPVVAGCGGRAGDSAPTGGHEPIGTITAKNDRVVIAPSLVKVNHGDDEKTGRREHSLQEPLGTVTAGGNGYALVAPSLIQTGYGEREGQAARALNIEEPLGTVVAGGCKHAVVAAHLSRQFGKGVGVEPGEPLPTVMPGGSGKTALVSAYLAAHYSERGGGFNGGHQMNLPMGTITTKDHHAPVAATLVKLRGECSGADVQEPMPTITAGGMHVAEVRAFLTVYYGEDGTSGQSLLEPLRTVTAKHRLGLVTVDGHAYQIADIGMRMLEPEELLRAQFGRFAAKYDLSKAKTKSGKVRLIGNSVPPEMSYALARSNVFAAPALPAEEREREEVA